jgi:hypothetical protein
MQKESTNASNFGSDIHIYVEREKMQILLTDLDDQIIGFHIVP